MGQEEDESTPQRGTLLRRAHELLETLGQPAHEDLLIQHLFAATGGNKTVWALLLRQTLRGSTLFEQTSEEEWSLSSWRSTQRDLNELDFVVLDTETTGLRPGSDRVIEVAGVRIHNGEVSETFQSLINPGRRLPTFITQFTGISQEMVREAPAAQEVIPNFLRFVEGAIIVGHNVGFDIGFLSYESQLLGQVFPLDGLDTIPLARRFLPDLRRFKLDAVASRLRVPTTNRHRALGDAQVTAEVFLKLLALARKQQIQTLGHLRRRLQLPVSWSGDIRDATLTRQVELWRADGKLSARTPVSARPTGSLLLNPAWRKDFPARPGVYLMKDEHGQVIYVGKAKVLKERLASYYNQPLGYTRKMDGLLQNVREIETRVLGSELEALLVESQLIKQLQPAYNVQLRNYEHYPFIKVDIQHPFPRVYSTRDVAADGARYFGPFRSGRLVNLTIEVVQKIFPIRTCTRSLPPQAKPSEPCLRLHLARCSGPCTGTADQDSYRQVIEEVCAFLGGEREDMLTRLRRQMLTASQQLNYERAAWLRDTIRNVEEVLIGQQLLTGAVESNNLFIIYPSAVEEHNEIFLVRHGRLVEQRCIPHAQEGMLSTLRELLALATGLGTPPSVVGKAEVDQINIISRWIHHHSSDRAFFPFQQALLDDDAAETLLLSAWTQIETLRQRPLLAQKAWESEESFESI